MKHFIDTVVSRLLDAVFRLCFRMLTRERQISTFGRLVAMGRDEQAIARLTGLSVESVKRVLAKDHQ